MPTATEIYTFLASSYNIGHWTNECNIIMIILVSRFVGAKSHALTSDNWYYVVLVGFMIAQKLWDDVPLGNKEFVQILKFNGETCCPERDDKWGSVDVRFLNRVEELFLSSISFDTHIKRKVYIEFMMELEAFRGAFQEKQRPRQPMNMSQATRLELVGAPTPLAKRRLRLPAVGTARCREESDAQAMPRRSGGIAMLS